MVTATVIGSGPTDATVANLPLWDKRNKAQSVLLLVSARPNTEKHLFDAIKRCDQWPLSLFSIGACIKYRSPASASASSSASVNSPAQYCLSAGFIFNHFTLAIRSTDG